MTAVAGCDGAIKTGNLTAKHPPQNPGLSPGLPVLEVPAMNVHCGFDGTSVANPLLPTLLIMDMILSTV